MRKALIISFILLLGVVGASFYTCWYFLNHPLQEKQDKVRYLLAPGTGANGMVRQLKKQGILNPLQAKLFAWWIQYKHAEKLLKAGEYQFSLSITPEALLNKFMAGDVVQYSVTFIEGQTFDEMMAIVSKLPAIKRTLEGKSYQEIMALIGEPTKHPEGMFFPDTYYFTANMSDLNVLQRAHHLLKEKLHAAWNARSPDLSVKTPYEALILASIIEKEAVVDEERSLISGVFQRRLALDMRLQADPTVIYGVKNEYNGRLTKAQLKQETPYNTYLHKGLPPTPIAMPGMKAIYAALHPAQGDALYFVAKGDGRHYFSQSLNEHNQAVKEFQLTPFSLIYKLNDGIQWPNQN